MRVREVTMDGFSKKISPFTFDEAEAYLKQGRELVSRDPKPELEDWTKRTLDTVCIALNKVPENVNGQGQWTPARVRAEIDGPFIRLLYDQMMDMSGIEIPKGEVQATSTT